MKIFVVENNWQQNVSEPAFSLRPETSLLRNNQPFFYPEYSKEIVCSVSIVIRICRIGRCIFEQFANRYFEEIGVGVCFTANDILRNLQQQNMPTDCARIFDFSAAVSPQMINIKDINNFKATSATLKINGKATQQSILDDGNFSVEKTIAQISQFISFKIGDLIFVNPAQKQTPISIGDKLEAQINNQKLLDFEIS